MRGRRARSDAPYHRQQVQGENSPKISRIEPMNRRKTSNTQHPISNNQWFPMPLIGGWVLDVGCWMFPRVHGEDRGEGRAKTNAPPLPSPLLHPMEERESIRLRLRRAA